MFQRGDIIENPVTGERILFRQTSSETDGELVEVEVEVQPGGFVATRHIHPHQEERFHILRGTVSFEAGREAVELGPGGRLTVPAGTPHRFWNAGEDTATFVAEVRPALQFEELLAAMFTLARDGRTNSRGMPNPLRLAVIAHEYFDTVRLPFPPAAVQRLGLAVAAPVGRLAGYRAGDGPVPATAA